MPNGEKDIRYANAGDDPVMTVTYNDLLEELRREYGFNQREPGDVSAKDMAEVTGLSVTSCRNVLNDKVNSGELSRIKVKGIGGYTCEYVYRKVK